MIYFHGYNKIFSEYSGKENFIYLAKKNILESIQEISGKRIRNQVEKNGLDRLHHFFSPDYLPFLEFSLKEKFSKLVYKQVYQILKKDLKINSKTFYIDKDINYRIHYPFQSAIKSRLTIPVYKSLNLENYKNAEKELNKSIKNQSKYKMKREDLGKASFLGKLPIHQGHGPHRDTWVGHTFNALNLWWSISNVSERTGVILYNQTNNYKLQHEKNHPSYMKKNKHYTGKPKVISMKDGELLVFDPEILHASRIITNDQTRIVFSARINENKPKFYKKSGEVEFPYWLRSDDIKNNTCNKIHTFYKKNNFANPDQKKDFKIAKFEKKIIKEKIKFGKKYKIFRKDKIDKEKNYKIIFKNYEISLVFRGGKFYAFKSRCPHLNFDLSLGHFDKSAVTCPGHGQKFNLRNGKSECKSFKIKVFRVFLKENYYYLQT